ncbi:unnamed protein product [Symbiodinium pilosum]|uniref:BTB domain-containing protein n=1 Tax=Symbiodinium pilosum TaxID=2952 RepID=A0A812SAH7_SYMPI|nr:unnamed protein product [Symbiodinium pilosum]
MVKFLLKDSAPIFFDKRLLTARCEYFQEMFAQTTWREALTSEIDMRSDSDADSRSMSALCIFLMSDVFDAQGDEQLAMSVRRLADRYRLPSLVDKAEGELGNLLCADNALSMLGQVTGSGGRLERACLELITENNCDLLEQQQEKLDTIADANPELVKQLFRILLDARGKKRRTTE